MTAEELAEMIYDLRIEMNQYVDRIDAGFRNGDIFEANKGKRKLSGTVKRFGHVVKEYEKMTLSKMISEGK